MHNLWPVIETRVGLCLIASDRVENQSAAPRGAGGLRGDCSAAGSYLWLVITGFQMIYSVRRSPDDGQRPSWTRDILGSDTPADSC